MTTLYPDGSNHIQFTVPCFDDDGDVLTLVSATLRKIDGVVQASNPAWFDAGYTTSGEEREDGVYVLNVNFDLDLNIVPFALYEIELVATDGTVNVTATFELDIRQVSYTPLPTDIGNLQGWFAASALVGYSDGEVVTEMPNLSPNDATMAVQTETECKPSFVLSDPDIGGASALQFDALDDYLLYSKRLGSYLTLFFVAKSNPENSASSRYLWTNDGNAPIQLSGSRMWRRLQQDTNADEISYECGDSNGLTYSVFDRSFDEWHAKEGYHIYALVIGASGMRLFVNGVLKLYDNTVLYNPNHLYQCFGYRLGGRLAEMIAYDKALTSNERQLVEIYLAKKYNLWVGPNLDFDPNTDIPNLYARFTAEGIDASDLNGAKVITWRDRSGNGHDVTQIVDANRPELVTGTAAGRPTLKFRGSHWLQSGAFGTVLGENSTMFIVLKSDIIHSNRDYQVIDGIANGYRQQVKLRSPQTVVADQGGGEVTGSYDMSDYTILAIKFNAAGEEVWINGRKKGTGAGGGHTLTGLTIGANWDLSDDFFEGEIAEIIIIEGELTLGQRAQIETYLAWRYGTDFYTHSPNP